MASDRFGAFGLYVDADVDFDTGWDTREDQGGAPGAGGASAAGSVGADGADGLKEAFGLPDSLPPIRLAPPAALAALAREAPLAGQLAALAAWAGSAAPGGREVDAAGDPLPADEAAAAAAVGVHVGELPFWWEYALAADWLVFGTGDEDRVLPGVTATAWEADDEAVFAAWCATLDAVLLATLIVASPEYEDEEFGDAEDAAEDEDLDDFDGAEDEEPALDFQGLPLGLLVLLFMSRGEGTSVAELTEVFWADAAIDMTAAEAAVARAEWEAAYGDPVRLLLGKLAGLHAITQAGDAVHLTPLALAALHERLVEAGVDIPLLPPTAGELTSGQLLAMAGGVTEAEFEAESAAWVAARGADAAARELLAAAADSGPGDRLLAVAAVTRIGPGAAPAWRDSLDVPHLRGYAKAGLATLDGDRDGPGDYPPGLEPSPADLAWMATDLLTLACDDEFPDPDGLAVSLREAVPPGTEDALFDVMWRGVHPDAAAVLKHVGRYHPDKRVAKAARTAAHKAASR
jgi:hypothetical protein